MRVPTNEELVHERLGKRFEEALSQYDTDRRVAVLVDEFLGPQVKGKLVLDVGCGLGFFSERLQQMGALVTACDIGEGLLERTRARVCCVCDRVDALSLEEQYGRERFDAVVSSECIEHTPYPMRAVKQMISVLKPEGVLSISTPNVLWYPVVRSATSLRLRPFNGYENFSSWKGLRKTLTAGSMTIVRERGLHLYPFQLGLHRLSTWCDENLQFVRAIMINICILARKGGPAACS